MTSSRRGESGGQSTGQRNADDIRFVDRGWERLLDDAMTVAGGRLRIICPFIKRGVVERLLKSHAPNQIEVLTRFDTRHFCDEVCDVEALELLLEHGARIRGVRKLHAKMYQFGHARAIVTSANLTRAALRSNHEFGFVADDPDIIARCGRYFDELWDKAGPDLTPDRVAIWKETVGRYRLRGAPPHFEGLGDEGVDVGLSGEVMHVLPPEPVAFRSFVKFFGAGDNRADRSMLVRDAVERSGCHWACTYPKGKRPRQVEDGSIMFMAYLVQESEDIVIFGRAIGLRHEDARDDASPAEIERRDWKARWPHYVRVHHAEFISGDLHGGVSLNAMMEALGSDSFVSTQRNARNGDGNTDPRRAYMKRPDVELSPQAYHWLAERLRRALLEHGQLSPAVMAALDWPE